MAVKTWQKETLRIADNRMVEAVKPVVISASRSTDIPAFHGPWMQNRLRAGYCAWTNPFNRERQYISFTDARVFVFWTKNPAPFLPVLPELDNRRLNYYFQFTLNDYETEGLEPHAPPLAKRAETFRRLSETIGRDRVIWRFDPLILTGDMAIDALVERVYQVGRMLEGHTRKLVISFADIDDYRKVASNLRGHDIRWRNFSKEEMIRAATSIKAMASSLGLEVAACAEELDLSNLGIEKNRCIDDRLMRTLFPHDTRLMDFLGVRPRQTLLFAEPEKDLPDLKDRGQRKACGCIVSKDIGSYDTCLHLCRYCYANGSPERVKRNFSGKIDPGSEAILEMG